MRENISTTPDFMEKGPSLGNRSKTSKGPRITSEELHPTGYDALRLPLKPWPGIATWPAASFSSPLSTNHIVRDLYWVSPKMLVGRKGIVSLHKCSIRYFKPNLSWVSKIGLKVANWFWVHTVWFWLIDFGFPVVGKWSWVLTLVWFC